MFDSRVLVRIPAQISPRNQYHCISMDDTSVQETQSVEETVVVVVVVVVLSGVFDERGEGGAEEREAGRVVSVFAQ